MYSTRIGRNKTSHVFDSPVCSYVFKPPQSKNKSQCSDFADLYSDFIDICLDFADFDMRGIYDFLAPRGSIQTYWI